jgi:hypothetical protein
MNVDPPKTVCHDLIRTRKHLKTPGRRPRGVLRESCVGEVADGGGRFSYSLACANSLLYFSSHDLEGGSCKVAVEDRIRAFWDEQVFRDRLLTTTRFREHNGMRVGIFGSKLLP